MDDRRLVLEHKAMMERWSALNPTLRARHGGRRLWWELDIRAEGDNRLPVRIEYPADYPATYPEIVICKPMPKGTPHLLPGRRMCWLYPGETRRNRNIWCPGKDTAATCVGVAHRWFCAFLVWLSLGAWPVPDALDARRT